MDRFSDEAFAAYLAAFIDGEGSIILHQVRYNHFVRVIITNTHIGVLESIVRRLGCGTIYRRNPGSLGKKPMFQLYFDGLDVNERVVRLARPYLIIKAHLADEAMKIFEDRKIEMESRNNRNSDILADINSHALSQKEIAKKYGLSQQMISFIKKGKYWPSKQRPRKQRK